MKITHLFHHYAPVVGGMEKVVQNIAEEQAAMGHDVHVVTSLLRAEQETREEILNKVAIKRLNALRLHYPDLTYPLERADNVLRESDIVHAHTQKSLFNHLLAHRAKKLGTSVLMDFISVDYLETHRNIFVRYVGSFYQHLLERKSLHFVDVPITLNKRDYGKLKQKFGVDSVIVPNGLEKRYFTKPKDEDLFRKTRNIQCENLFACIGRVVPSKGVDLLIRATAKIPSVLDFKIVIAGKGPSSYLSKLHQLVKALGVEDRVVFVGYISEEEKISLIDSALAVVLPTRHTGECWSLVTSEAFARDTPVIATTIGVLPYRITHGKTGMLIPPDDVSSLAEALSHFLNHPEEVTVRRELKKSRESLLNWHEVSKQLENIYRYLEKKMKRM